MSFESLPRPLQSLRSAVAWGLTAGDTALLATAAIGLSVVDQGGDRTYHLGRFWSRLNLRVIRTSVTVVGKEHVVPGSPYVAMANHSSHVDIWAVYAALPLQIRWVMKQELRKVPIFGLACDRMGHLYVQRGNSESARESMARAAQAIRRGTTVVFFPEGTRSLDGQLGRFKTGGFRLALQAQVPVLPVAIQGTRTVLPPKEWRHQPGRVRVAIGQPIATAGRDEADLQELVRQTRKAIEVAMDPSWG